MPQELWLVSLSFLPRVSNAAEDYWAFTSIRNLKKTRAAQAEWLQLFLFLCSYAVTPQHTTLNPAWVFFFFFFGQLSLSPS